MARRRLIYVLALVSALLFQIFDVGYLAHFLLWAALTLPLVSLLLTLPAVLGYKGALSAAPAAVERGEPARFLAGLRGNGWLPLPRVTMRLRLENAMTGERVRRRVVLSGLREGLWTGLEVPTGRCGRVECRVERLRAVDCLGLFALPLRKPAPAGLLCLPRRGTEGLPKALEGTEEGPLAPRPGGGPGEDYDLRPYRPGDPVASIHWKLSSKRDETVVRETLERRRAQVCITFDHFGTGEALDQTLDRLYTWSSRLVEQGRVHTVAWVHPETGQARRFLVADGRSLSRCLAAILSDPAPAQGRSIREMGGAGPGVHLLPGGEVAP